MTLKLVVRETYPQYSLEVEFVGEEVDEIMRQMSETMPKIHRTIRQYFPFPTFAKGRGTCKELILRLVAEGSFDEAQNLEETRLNLQKLGFNFDRTNVAHALHELSMNGPLRRLGTRRYYQYQRKGTKIKDDE